MKKILVTAILTVICSLSLSVLVRAESSGHQKNGPCQPDIKKFCADVKPGGGRIIECLKAHEPELSPACQERRATIQKEAKAVHAACAGDAEKFCQNVQPGQGRIAKCLKQHQSELSSQCQSAISTAKAENKANKIQTK